MKMVAISSQFLNSDGYFLSRGVVVTLEALRPEKAWVVCPLTDPGYPLRNAAPGLPASSNV